METLAKCYTREPASARGQSGRHLWIKARLDLPSLWPWEPRQGRTHWAHFPDAKWRLTEAVLNHDLTASQRQSRD